MSVSPHPPPLVTVITIVRNGRALIERAIRSVLEQTYPRIEYIIKDGASTDGTLEILEQYRDRIALVDSRPDGGISSAWNQALVRASGRYVALLNADDAFEPTLVEQAVDTLERTGADLAYCDVKLASPGVCPRLLRGHWDPGRLWLGTGFLHPGVLARAELYRRIGCFREDLRFAMDADWLLRAHRSGARFVKHGGVCVMSLEGVSNTRWAEARREYVHVLREQRLPLHQRALAWIWFAALLAKKWRPATGRR